MWACFIQKGAVVCALPEKHTQAEEQAVTIHTKEARKSCGKTLPREYCHLSKHWFWGTKRCLPYLGIRTAWKTNSRAKLACFPAQKDSLNAQDHAACAHSLRRCRLAVGTTELETARFSAQSELWLDCQNGASLWPPLSTDAKGCCKPRLQVYFTYTHKGSQNEMACQYLLGCAYIFATQNKHSSYSRWAEKHKSSS